MKKATEFPKRAAWLKLEMLQRGNMTPHREPAWALLAERVRIFAQRCRQVAAERNDGAGAPESVISEAAEQAQAVADALTAQVPKALRPRPDRAFPA